MLEACTSHKTTPNGMDMFLHSVSFYSHHGSLPLFTCLWVAPVTSWIHVFTAQVFTAAQVPWVSTDSCQWPMPPYLNRRNSCRCTLHKIFSNYLQWSTGHTRYLCIAPETIEIHIDRLGYHSCLFTCSWPQPLPLTLDLTTAHVPVASPCYYAGACLVHIAKHVHWDHWFWPPPPHISLLYLEEMLRTPLAFAATTNPSLTLTVKDHIAVHVMNTTCMNWENITSHLAQHIFFFHLFFLVGG